VLPNYGCFLKLRIVRATKIANFSPTKGNHFCATPNYFCRQPLVFKEVKTFVAALYLTFPLIVSSGSAIGRNTHLLHNAGR